MPADARAQLLPSGTEVAVEKCFPLDDAPARSADCISWGPHNVLQVCTRWAVSMYLANLLTPACQRSVRHHPLAHRSDGESVEVVVGAKWSTTLLPEVYYPATARLCVQTTSNLVVYRVSRHGANRVVASHGIGIACSCGGLARLSAHSDGIVAEASPSERPLSCFLAAERPPIGKRHRGAAKSSVKVTSKPKTKPATKKTFAAARQKGRQGSCSTANSSGDDESASSSRSDASSSSGSRPLPSRFASRSRASATGAGKGGSSHESAMPTLVSAGNPDRAHAETNPVEADSASPENDDVGSVVDYTWLDQDDLLVLTIQGLHLVALAGNLSDNDGPVTRSLPPPLYRWGGEDEVAQLGFRGPAPLCMTPLFTDGLAASTATAAALARLRRIVVIASPYMLRVIHVTRSSPANATAVMHLAYTVEVPSLTSVPTSVCAAAVRHTGQTATRAADLPPEPEVDVVVFVSAPCAVLRGRFALAALSSSSESALPSPCRRIVFHVDAHYGSDILVGEVCLRRLMAVPFVADSRVAGADVGGEGDRINSSSTELDDAAVAVLGIGEKSVYEFLACGPSSAVLLQCPLLAGCSEMPPRRCAGIAGVALHPSGTLAVAAVQTGQANHEPTHLWPVSVDTRGGWLRRLVELGALVPDAVTGKPHEDSAFGGAVEPYESSGSIVRSMLLQQASTSFFLYEQLLPGSVAQSSEIHRYAQVHQQARQLPTTEMLHDYRRSMIPGCVASSRIPSLADVPARRRYLHLRAQYGVDLFLRWPLRLSTAAGDAASGVPSVFASPPSMDAMQASWPWWRLLQHIWAICPWDRPVLSELVLSNAVQILAKRYCYANMTLEGSESLRDCAVTVAESARCSTKPDALDVDGAIAFMEAYMKAQKIAVRKANGSTQAASSSSLGLITAADCAEPAGPGGDNERLPRKAARDAPQLAAQVHWCVSPSWVTSLEAFLEATAYSHRRSAGVSSAVGGNASETSSLHLFPCSLCDRPTCVPLLLGLSSTSTHVPAGDDPEVKRDASVTAPASHTTLFSGSTLSPLSFFSEDYVLTRCLACGLSDFADGPRCRVCGGMLE
ncbi:conserved hypothetical protein [Leishmania major strain Friedlin]|uniref:Uncharacterized protein n=1 Tax=Leishmania major TaxID=5664 RepID=Q4Q0M9_LEIMA|nr:conserved hypothetical protein [Leishmania major strain Friedlin]CAG9584085.1 hypothetical_protein_-_conserved [Leishmania major strain Friedlin]CAJ09505.1 conserved hypothetical protein [Leishmania major strain Friedlin]|eukprot:XP_001687119.1 conserved hypothetical protein [Leishmania major strain Friedlin]